MVDSVFHTRSLGTAAEGVRDQYADGKAAKVWEVFIGDKKQRTKNYKEFLVGLLREKGCRRILDVACGTGVDSVLLLEEGFDVVSVDASDKMLKYALKSRWDRRKEPAFDNWGKYHFFYPPEIFRRKSFMGSKETKKVTVSNERFKKTKVGSSWAPAIGSTKFRKSSEKN